MRRGIGLRGYAQQDPLNEFRREAYRLYEELRGLIRHGVASSIFRVTVTHQPPRRAAIRRRRVARPGRGGARGAAGTAHGTPAASGRRGARPGRGSRGAAARRSCAAARRRRRPPGASRESLGDQPVAPAAAAGRSARPAAPARATRRAARGSGATTRAGAARAPSTRSATALRRRRRPGIRPTSDQRFPSPAHPGVPGHISLLAIGIWPRILVQNLPRLRDRSSVHPAGQTPAPDPRTPIAAPAQR